MSGDWLLHENSIISFQNLTEVPWSNICDLGCTEDFDTREWAYSEDRERRRQFVQLLNRALRSQLYPGVRWWRALNCYVFVGNLTNTPKKMRYQSLKQETTVTVVSKYEKTNKEGRKFIGLRHNAFRGQFRVFGNQWYLEITPTYVFTYDGENQDRFHESKLSGIKRIERNRSVLSQVLLWAQTLAQPGDMFRPVPRLHFGELRTFTLSVGIDDGNWTTHDPNVSVANGEFNFFDLLDAPVSET